MAGKKSKSTRTARRKKGPGSARSASASLRTVLGSRDKLRQVESQIEDECLQIVRALSVEEARDLLEETYTLATEHAELRFSDISPAEDEIMQIAGMWQGKAVSARSLDELMAEAVRKVYSERQRQRLKKIIYKKIANSETPTLMSQWAVASVSLDTFEPGENPFLLGIFQTTFVEQLNQPDKGMQDLSKAVLAVDRDVEAIVGTEKAEQAARTPHLVSFLDTEEAFFGSEELEESAIRFFDWAQRAEENGRSRIVKREKDRLMGEILEQLLTPERRRHLQSQLTILRDRSQVGELPSEVGELATAALELFDTLPVGLNPFLQTVWVGSIERFLEEI